MIIPFATGDCRNYEDFIRADVGIKPKRTFPLGQNYDLVLDLLAQLVRQNNMQIENASTIKNENIYSNER